MSKANGEALTEAGAAPPTGGSSLPGPARRRREKAVRESGAPGHGGGLRTARAQGFDGGLPGGALRGRARTQLSH